MELYSTKHLSPNVNLKQAVLTGLPADNGLYVPTHIPRLDHAFFNTISHLTFTEIAYQVSKILLEGEIENEALKILIEDAFNFETPIVEIEENIYVLELFHGPTMAFKDYGARFMSRLMSHFLRNSNKEINILVATSGDTGGAVGHGFLDVDGIKVTILYPKGKVSEIQEKQLTTIGNNVTTIEVNGNFDDCQQLVKTAFLDEDLGKKLNLTSANSINIARLIPQSFYYFHAYATLKNKQLPIACSVPSGNFGNLCGALIAYQMGLPIAHFIASTNVNDIVPAYLNTGLFNPRKSMKTISNAMDVGNPSNFPRILALFNNDEEKLKETISGFSFDDELTRNAIKEVYKNNEYLICPHTAVAYLGLKQWLETQKCTYSGLFLSTAHPAKFLDEVAPVIGKNIDLPPALSKAYDKEKVAIELSNNFEELKSFLMGKN